MKESVVEKHFGNRFLGMIRRGKTSAHSLLEHVGNSGAKEL